MKRCLQYTFFFLPAFLAGGVAAVALDNFTSIEQPVYFTMIISLPIFFILLVGNMAVERASPGQPHTIKRHFYQCALLYGLALICVFALSTAEQTGSLQFAYVKGFLLTASCGIIMNIVYTLVKK